MDLSGQSRIQLWLGEHLIHMSKVCQRILNPFPVTVLPFQTGDKCCGQAGSKALKEGHLSAIEEALLGAWSPAGYRPSNISPFPLFFDLAKCKGEEK